MKPMGSTSARYVPSMRPQCAHYFFQPVRGECDGLPTLPPCTNYAATMCTHSAHYVLKPYRDQLCQSIMRPVCATMCPPVGPLIIYHRNYIHTCGSLEIDEDEVESENIVHIKQRTIAVLHACTKLHMHERRSSFLNGFPQHGYLGDSPSQRRPHRKGD